MTHITTLRDLRACIAADTAHSPATEQLAALDAAIAAMDGGQNRPVARIYIEGDMRSFVWLEVSAELPDGEHSLFTAPQPAANSAPLHPNHRSDLRYILGVLERLSKATPGDGDLAAAVTGMRYVLNRTEEAAQPQPSGNAGEMREGVHASPALTKCPITGRPYFMTIEHPDMGMVETFGGPLDSYTVPVLDGAPNDAWHDREMRCERYDHDEGSWVEGGEPVPLRIVHEDLLFELQEQAALAAQPSGQTQQYCGIDLGAPEGDRTMYAVVAVCGTQEEAEAAMRRVGQAQQDAEEERQRVGEALSAYLGGLAEDGVLTLDPFDAHNIDGILDVIDAARQGEGSAA